MTGQQQTLDGLPAAQQSGMSLMPSAAGGGKPSLPDPAPAAAPASPADGASPAAKSVPGEPPAATAAAGAVLQPADDATSSDSHPSSGGAAQPQPEAAAASNGAVAFEEASAAPAQQEEEAAAKLDQPAAAPSSDGMDAFGRAETQPAERQAGQASGGAAGDGAMEWEAAPASEAKEPAAAAEKPAPAAGTGSAGPPAAEPPAVEAGGEAAALAAVQATADALVASCETATNAAGIAAAGAAPSQPAQADAAAAADQAGLSGSGAAGQQAEGLEGQAEDDDGMPDPSDAGAMLTWLRSRIPQSLLDEYREPLKVSEEDKAETLRRIQVYEEEVERVRPKVKAKPDLVAATKLPAKHPEWGLWEKTCGHTPGVFPGQVFKGRGWLAALGIHTNYYAGIMSSGNQPAQAICLSGGYDDDDDHGDWMYYTGKGGQNDKGKQIKSQAFTGPNACIRACMEQGRPLRVCRRVQRTEVDPVTGREKKQEGREYTYDGLYAVIKADLVDSKHGKAQVCKFLLVGIPGHYQANKAVSFVEMRGFRHVRLAAGDDEDEDEDDEEWDDWQRYPKRKRGPTKAERGAAAEAAAGGAGRKRKKPRRRQAEVVQDAEWEEAQRGRPGFVCLDVSGGAEQRKIPVLNEVDDAQLEPFEYVRTSVLGSQAAVDLAEAAQKLMPVGYCGLKRGYCGAPAYSRCGRMNNTESMGYWECGPECTDKECACNRRISERGITLPLEVFRTRSKGWGVRCAEDVLIGSVVCTYEGEIVTNEEAEQRKEADSYLYDLDHFMLMHQDRTVTCKDKLPPLPREALGAGTDDLHKHLVVDALGKGNVARFINHSCQGNLAIQAVIRPGDSGLLFAVALVAEQDIPAGVELTYDYKYKAGTITDKEIQCHCGARRCRGRLL